MFKDWQAAEKRFQDLAQNLGRHVVRMPYSHVFDYLIDGWRVEFKHSPLKYRVQKRSKKVKRPHRLVRPRPVHWTFNIHRGGSLSGESKCDFYVLCLEDAIQEDGQRWPIYLLYPSPLRVKVFAITRKALKNGKVVDRLKAFANLCSGCFGKGPFAPDPEPDSDPDSTPSAKIEPDVKKEPIVWAKWKK